MHRGSMTARTDAYQRRTSTLVIASSLSTAVTLFATFRFTAQLASVEWIGVWSLVQGLFLVARVGDSGAGNNITRFTAVRVKDGTSLDLRNLTTAALLIASLPSVILAVVATPLIGLYVTARFGDELTRSGLWTIVGLALLFSVCAALSNVLLAICEGMFALNFKSTVVISANFVGLCVLVPLLTIAGPTGIGWVYVVIAATQLVLVSARITWLIRSVKAVQRLSVREHISQLWRENLHLSGIALIRLSFEPVTKLFLSLFAPLALVALFELALRVTTQIRIVVQSALQPLLALGARPAEEAHAAMHDIFVKNDRVLSALALGGLITQILAAPAVEWLGLGTHDAIFVVFFALLAAGNAINIMGLSGYYWQLTSGSLWPLVKVQAVMGIANIVIGGLGLALRSAVIVVLAYSVVFAYGGLVTRAYLRDVPRSTKVITTLLVVGGGAVSSAVVVVLRPDTAVPVWLLFGCGTVVGVCCLALAYRASRRSPR